MWCYITNNIISSGVILLRSYILKIGEAYSLPMRKIPKTALEIQ